MGQLDDSVLDELFDPLYMKVKASEKNAGHFKLRHRHHAVCVARNFFFLPPVYFSCLTRIHTCPRLEWIQPSYTVYIGRMARIDWLSYSYLALYCS